MSSERDKIRVLVFAEGATLAHTARAAALTAGLSKEIFSVTIACSPQFKWALKGSPWPVVPLACQAPEIFASRLAKGLPVFTRNTLEHYVIEDERLIEAYAPDIVVGDFRISLGISARRRKVHYLNLINAYWSPLFAARPVLPSLPLLSLLPIRLGQKLFQASYPIASWAHAMPMEALRRQFGLPSLNHDLGRIYCDADTVAFCDLPSLYDNRVLPSSHHFIGPVLWNPPVPLPDWWPDVQKQDSLIYVTLGSSGDKRLLQKVIAGLVALGYPLAIARAGAVLPDMELPANAFVSDYLPGDALCQRAALVVCNGGSPTTQQALAAGKPVLGIPHNLDQYMNMQRIENYGAGLSVRSDRADVATIEAAARALLGNANFLMKATQLAEDARRLSAPDRFEELLHKAVGNGQ